MINILLMSDTGISPADAGLLAPQSRHHLRECQQSAAAAGKPLACIDPDMFWDLQSAAVLDLALSLLKNP